MQEMLMYLRSIKFSIMYVCMYVSVHPYIWDHQVLQMEQIRKNNMYVCNYVCNYPVMVCQNKMPTILTFTTASRHDFFFFLMCIVPSTELTNNYKPRKKKCPNPNQNQVLPCILTSSFSEGPKTQKLLPSSNCSNNFSIIKIKIIILSCKGTSTDALHILADTRRPKQEGKEKKRHSAYVCMYVHTCVILLCTYIHTYIHAINLFAARGLFKKGKQDKFFFFFLFFPKESVG